MNYFAINMPANILIIDDEEQLRKLTGRVLALEGFIITETGTLKAAADLLRHKYFDIVLCDVKLPDGNGVDFTAEIKARYPLTEVILLTAYGNIPDGVMAIKNGAFDYITKGNDNDRIVPLLHQAMDKVLRNKKEAVVIKETGATTFKKVIGSSPQIKEAVKLAERIAPADANVLLLGETGTGKDVFANAIHAASRRAAKPFVAINCSAFTKDLLEGELFGHKAGAYTGAVKDKKGLIETADGGTLFLDEIGEMNIELQSKLLRVLENGEFIKLGDTKTSKVDVRIIAATNKDLKKSIEENLFREDLYYRLNVLSITLPPLRERKEDIILLAQYFAGYFGAKDDKTISINSDAKELLQKFEWKGNIRELKNVMERAVILTDTNEITPTQLPYEIQKQADATANTLSLASVEKLHIEKVLLHFHNNKTKAAEALGIGLTTLYRKMEEYGIAK